MKMFKPISKIEILAPLTLPHTQRVKYVAVFFWCCVNSDISVTHKKMPHELSQTNTQKFSEIQAKTTTELQDQKLLYIKDG